MAKVGQADFRLLVTTASATSAFHDISDYVTEFSGLNIEAILQQSDAFGDSWQESLYTGIRKTGDITVKGFYDDVAASGPHAIFGALTALGNERVFKMKFGTTNEYPKVDVIIKSYARMPRRAELTGYELVVVPTGAVTNGTT